MGNNPCLNSAVKWKGEEQYQNVQQTVDEKFKEYLDIHNVMELKRAQGEMKNAKPRAFLL